MRLNRYHRYHLYSLKMLNYRLPLLHHRHRLMKVNLCLIHQHYLDLILDYRQRLYCLLKHRRRLNLRYRLVKCHLIVRNHRIRHLLK
jgi:hypothetical protein